MNKVDAHKKVHNFCKYILKQDVSLEDRLKLFPTLILPFEEEESK